MSGLVVGRDWMGVLKKNFLESVQGQFFKKFFQVIGTLFFNPVHLVPKSGLACHTEIDLRLDYAWLI
jgi:hypothetical protein